MSKQKIDEDKVDKTISWIDKVKDLVFNYGTKNLALYGLILILISIIGYYVLNPDSIVERVQTVIEKQSDNEYEQRLEADTEIRNVLINLRSDVCADRTFVLEAHNGGSNLTGLKFLYLDMTYDEPSRAYDKRSLEYLNMRTSSYPWVPYLYEKEYWMGPVDSILPIDPEVYYKLEKDGLKYIAVVMMYGTNNPCGCVGIVYYNEENVIDEVTLRRELRIASNKIRNILDVNAK